MTSKFTIKRPRFTVQVLLIAVTFVALSLVSWNSYYGWYKQNHGYYVISRVLREKIRNGDSFEAVSSRLIFVEEASSLFKNHPNADWYRRHYAARPSGLRDSDKFMEFNLGNAGVILQFRDKKLINHDPTEFTDSNDPFDWEIVKQTPIAKQIAEVRREMGMSQAIAALVAIIASTIATGLAKQRRYSQIRVRAIITIPVAIGTAIICMASKLQPTMLSLVVVGLAASVTWNVSGRFTKPTATQNGTEETTIFP